MLLPVYPYSNEYILEIIVSWYLPPPFMTSAKSSNNSPYIYLSYPPNMSDRPTNKASPRKVKNNTHLEL